MAPKITLYLDIVSPFAYEAYYILRHDPVFSKCDITYIPIFLGGVMKACNNTPPINIKNKDKWIGLERIRWAKLFNIPMNETLPQGFPALTLLPMRALSALSAISPPQEEQQQLCKAFDALFYALWVEHKETTKPEVLTEILKDALGENMTKKIMESIGNKGKEILVKNTDKALADGAFGLPWFVCTDNQGRTECFWGVDHLGQVTAFLGIEKPKMGGWKSVL